MPYRDKQPRLAAWSLCRKVWRVMITLGELPMNERRGTIGVGGGGGCEALHSRERLPRGDGAVQVADGFGVALHPP